MIIRIFVAVINLNKINMDANFIFLIGSVISLIVTIWLLTKINGIYENGRAMLDAVVTNKDFESAFKLYLACGRNDLALEVLIKQMRSDINYKLAVESPSGKTAEVARVNMHKDYDIYFKALGQTLDFEKLNVFYNI